MYQNVDFIDEFSELCYIYHSTLANILDNQGIHGGKLEEDFVKLRLPEVSRRSSESCSASEDDSYRRHWNSNVAGNVKQII